MQLQLGVKNLEEIESLVNSNCWKALFWDTFYSFASIETTLLLSQSS